MADKPRVKLLKEKYADRIEPSDKDIEKGVVALTPLQVVALNQGIDPESGIHWTAGDTLRNDKRQTQEASDVKEQGDKAANIGISEDREGVNKVTTESDNKAVAEADRKAAEASVKEAAADKKEDVKTASLRESQPTKAEEKEIDKLAAEKENRRFNR